MKIDDVIDKVVELLQQEPELQGVQQYHKVNGILPDIGKSISVGCEKVNFTTYTNSIDQADASVFIYAYTQEADPEMGEKEVRNMAEAIRYCLNENPTLSGAISSSEVKDIEYIYADASDTLLWHAAIIQFSVTYYQSKRREKPPAPINEINNQVEKE